LITGPPHLLCKTPQLEINWRCRWWKLGKNQAFDSPCSCGQLHPMVRAFDTQPFVGYCTLSYYCHPTRPIPSQRRRYCAHGILLSQLSLDQGDSHSYKFLRAHAALQDFSSSPNTTVTKAVAKLRQYLPFDHPLSSFLLPPQRSPHHDLSLAFSLISALFSTGPQL
jgi:hypothetical protein